MNKFKSFFGLDKETISRKKFITSNVIANLVFLPLLAWPFLLWLVFPDIDYDGDFMNSFYIATAGVIAFFTIWIVYGTAGRRLRDIGNSQNLVLLYLVPWVGFGLMLYLAVRKGKQDTLQEDGLKK